MALVNARMGPQSYERRARLRGLYKDLLARFLLISAQDPISAANIGRIGSPVPVQIHPSLKLIAPTLSADASALRSLRDALGTRRVWMVGPSHTECESRALEAHRQILASDPRAILIIVPRYPERSTQIIETVHENGFRVSLRSANTVPSAADQVFVADSFGEMGLWYRLASTAMIGGTFSEVEGHNPWEAARLGAAILYGPHTANFLSDYSTLRDSRAATMVETPQDITAAVLSDLGPQSARAAACCAENSAAITELAAALVDLIPGPPA
jgi:3-deoxy-D-manno-octulosonic-acid transferase